LKISSQHPNICPTFYTPLNIKVAQLVRDFAQQTTNIGKLHRGGSTGGALGARAQTRNNLVLLIGYKPFSVTENNVVFLRSACCNNASSLGQTDGPNRYHNSLLPKTPS